VAAVAPDGSPVELYALLPDLGEGEIVARAVPEGGEIVELGCGTGRIVRQLVTRGYRVVGVDQSPEMLAHVQGAETIEADIETVDLGRRFDAVVLASNLFNEESPAVRRAFLEACVRHGDLLVIERLPPDWQPSSDRSRLGEIETWLEDVVIDGDVVHGAVVYETNARRWRHEFSMRRLDDEQTDAALAEVGLRVDRYLDEKRTWLKAVPALRARA
jgi:SAM-dependent methyltransferase